MRLAARIDLRAGASTASPQSELYQAIPHRRTNRSPYETIDHERFLGAAPHRQSELAKVIGDPSWQLTFLFLAGYPTQGAHTSPRRPAEMTVVA